MRRDELAPFVACPVLDAVVHERDARLATRESEEQHHRRPRAGCRARARAGARRAAGSSVSCRVVAHDPLGQSLMTKTIRVERVSSLQASTSSGTALRAGRADLRDVGVGGRLVASYGAGAELRVHRCFSPENELVAIVPLYRRRARSGVVRFLGHGQGTSSAPSVRRASVALAGASLSRALEGLAWDVFAGEQLPARAGWPAAPGGTRGPRSEPRPPRRAGAGRRISPAGARTSVSESGAGRALLARAGAPASGSRTSDARARSGHALHAPLHALAGRRPTSATRRSTATLRGERCSRGWLRLWTPRGRRIAPSPPGTGFRSVALPATTRRAATRRSTGTR